MKTFINTYADVSKPTVVNNITMTEWLSQIKSSKYSMLIESARTGATDKKTLKSILPCVTYNFTYNGYKKDENIISSTGFIYIDIDVPDFNIDSLDLTKIYSYYRSVGGEGYAILVRVEGLNKNNFKSSYQSIVSTLLLNNYVDTNAIKHSQFNVLSFDENVFINESSYVFQSVDSRITEKSTHCDVNKKGSDIYDIRGAFPKKIRYDNKQAYIESNQEYISDWENGYQIIKCWIPYTHKIRDGKRYNYLLSYGNNLLWLNQWLSLSGLINNLKHVNPVACTSPIDENQIIKIANTLIKQLKDKKLQPIVFNKICRVIFNENSKLTKDEKFAITRQERAKNTTQKSKKKIWKILEDWDFKMLGKISQPALVANNEISRKTVQKYWSEYKAHVSALNENYKNQNIITIQKKSLKPQIKSLEQLLVVNDSSLAIHQ